MAIYVIHPGAMTSVQDLGRKGYLSMGVAHAGAMDAPAVRLANALLGNVSHAPVFEVLLKGPKLKVTSEGAVAVVGHSLAYESPDVSQFPVMINGIPVAMGEVHWLNVGDVLEVGAARWGARCWMAFSGGIAVAKVLGSASTHLKSQMGGILGRSLKSDDTCTFGKGDVSNGDCLTHIGNRLEEAAALASFLPHANAMVIPVMCGPQAERLSDASLKRFYHQEFTLTQQCDRMGYRLQGAPLEYREASQPDILSEPNAIGAIQVPGDGQPLVLLHDAGTTGGYGKVAIVPKVFLRNLSQMRPGDTIKFVQMGIGEAQTLLLEQDAHMRLYETKLCNYKRPSDKSYRISVLGKYYHAFVQEI